MSRAFTKPGVSGVLYTEALWVQSGECAKWTKARGREWKRRLMQPEAWGGAPVNKRAQKSRTAEGPPGHLKANISVRTRNNPAAESGEMTAHSKASYSLYVHEGTRKTIVGRWKRPGGAEARARRLEPGTWMRLPANGYRTTWRRQVRGQKANPILARTMDAMLRHHGVI